MRVLAGHTDPVLCLAFAPDGRSLVSGSEDGVAILWDVASGTKRMKLRPLKGNVSITAVTFAPEEELIAVAQGSNVWLWDLVQNIFASPGNPGYLDGARANGSLAFHPGGRHLAIGFNDDHIRLWKMGPGPRVEAMLEMSGTRTIAFSPRGNVLAAGGGADLFTGHLAWWGLSGSDQMGGDWQDKAAGVRSIAYSPDGNWLAAACGRLVLVVELGTGQSQILTQANSHALFFHCVAFSQDGGLLAVGRWDGRIDFYDVGSWTIRKTMNSHSGNVYSVVFSADGLTGASAGDDYVIRLWSVEDVYS